MIVAATTARTMTPQLPQLQPQQDAGVLVRTRGVGSRPRPKRWPQKRQTRASAFTLSAQSGQFFSANRQPHDLGDRGIGMRAGGILASGRPCTVRSQRPNGRDCLGIQFVW